MYKRTLLPLDGTPLAEVMSPSAKVTADGYDTDSLNLRLAASVKEFSFSDHVPTFRGAREAGSDVDACAAKTCMLKVGGIQTNDQNFEGKIADAIMDAETTDADAIARSVNSQPDIQGWDAGPLPRPAPNRPWLATT